MPAIATEPDKLTQLNDSFADLVLKDRFALIGEHWGDSALASTSAGAQSAVMLHLLSKHLPDLPVVFIDTGYHFPETYHYISQLQELFPINLQVYSPKLSAARQEALHGKLWEQGEEGLEKYGVINKVEPMDRALKDNAATTWLSGVRRSQSDGRSTRTFLEQQKNTLKIYPILDWSNDDIANYMEIYSLPKHPLVARGYASIGDWHSSQPVEEGMREEDSRFNGVKRECGLHEASGNADFQI